MSKSRKKQSVLLARFSPFCYDNYHMEIIQTVQPALPYVQIILSVLLVAGILLQQRGSSLGGAFGGDNFSSAFHKRRGAELFLFQFSIGIAILFVIATFLNILV